MLQRLEQKLKKYDRYLEVVKTLDGTLKVLRKSPFGMARFDVLAVSNAYPGDWILKKVASMDTQRKNIIMNVLYNNLEIRNRNNDREINEDIADFMTVDRILI
jgi:hypothetical protein